MSRHLSAGRNSRKRRWTAAAAAIASGLALVPAAMAQTAKDDSVTGRPRPDFNPIGMELDEILYRLGMLDRKTVEEKRSPLSSFIVHATTELETRYQSNLYRTERDSGVSNKSDETESLRPALSIASDWVNHGVNFAVGGDIARHLHYQSEDYNNVRALLGGRLDASDALVLNLETRYLKVQEPRGTPDDLGATFRPVTTYTEGVGGGARYQADMLLLHLKGQIDDLAFKDGDPASTPLRDRTESLAALRTGWEFTPGTTLFVEPAYNTRVYKHDFDQLGFRQGSQGYRTLVGVTWDASGKTFAELGVGWLHQSYKDARFKPTNGPSVDGKLIWNATEVLTLTANLNRRVEESATVDAITNQSVAAVLVSQAVFGADYEVLDNLIVSGRIDFSKAKFEGSERRDDIVVGSVGLDYRIGDKWYARFGYDDVRRASNQTGLSFTDNIVSLRLGLQL